MNTARDSFALRAKNYYKEQYDIRPLLQYSCLYTRRFHFLL